MTSVNRQHTTVTSTSGTGGGEWDHRLNRLLEDLQGTVTPPEGHQNVSEFREYRTYSSSKKNNEPVQTTSEKWVEYGTQGGAGPGISQRLKDSTLSSNTTTRERTLNFNNGRVTPPPPQSEGLKTPPLVRKILQSSTASHHHHQNSKKMTDYDSTKPLCAQVPLNSSPVNNEPTSGSRYFTSTTTRTEHRKNQEISPRTFPSAQPREYYGEPPKRLDDLMSTFENNSYTETRKVHGEGGSPYRPAYGPGMNSSVEPVRQVRIDDNVTSRTIIDEEHERKNGTNYQNPLYQPKEVEPTRNVSGPPVYYPSNQVFHTIEQESKTTIQDDGKGNMKAKRKAEYKVKEKNTSNPKGRRVECQPVCCACTIV